MIVPFNIAMEHSPESALLVLLLRVKYGSSAETEIDLFIKEHAVNYEKLFQLLKEHEVESILYNTPVYDFSDAKVQLYDLKQRIEKRARINLLLFTELLQLNSLLQENGFNFIFYKGVLLSKLLFDDFTTRSTSDIDVLIRATEFPAIRRLLLQNGYEEVYFYPENYADYYIKISREFTFKRKLSDDLFISIEIQWAPLPAMYSIPYNNDYFFENITTIKLSGQDIPILKNEQLLLILLLHHGIADLWRNFKHVFDLAMFIKRYGKSLHWEEIFIQIEKWNMSKSAFVGLYLCKDLLGSDFPFEVPLNRYRSEGEKVKSSLLSYPLLPKRKKNYSNVQRQLLMSDNVLERSKLLLGYVETFLYPSTTDLEYLKFPKYLFPLYFITKHFRFILKNRK